jgi:pseudouridine kinase
MAGKGGRVVVVGGANIDIQGKPKAAFLPGDSNPGFVARSFGGVGRNIAENLARLGMDVELVAPLGRDAEGEALLADCRAKGIRIDHCPRSEAPSPTYLCLADELGGLVGAVADMAAMEEMVPARLALLQPYLEEADYLVADANLPRETLLWIAETFGRRGKAEGQGTGGPRLYVDPVSRTKAKKLLGIASSFDCVKPNRAEAFVLAGGAQGGAIGGENGDPAALCEAMRKKGNLPSETFISLGGEGMFFRTPGAEGTVAFPDLKDRFPVVNRSGAGDAACAALLWAEAQGFKASARAEFALAAAVLTASCPEPVYPGMGAEGLRLLRRELFSKETDR